MYCPKCGTQNDDIATSCSKCSFSLSQINLTVKTELTQEDQYQAIIGNKNQAYYLKHFEHFDADGKTSITWHWPAFFVTFFWLLYRKMWLQAALYFFVPGIVFGFIVGILSLIIGESAILLYIPYYVAIFILPAMYANAIYYKHCKTEIAQISRYKLSADKTLEKHIQNGGTSIAGILVPFVIAIPIIGILAAIAIPAYQDYVIKSYVAQAYSLEKEAASAVSNYYKHHQEIPKTLDAAGFTSPLPQQVGSLTIVDPVHGTIGLAMKRDVNKIGDRTLILIPSYEDSGEIIWECRSNIDKKYSPRDCVAF